MLSLKEAINFVDDEDVDMVLGPPTAKSVDLNQYNNFQESLILGQI